MEYTIKYNRAKCIGAASCADIAPDTWELDSDGLAKAKINKFSDDVKDKNVKAAKSCPEHAIEIFDSDGNKIV
tara:strand:+ start:1627 stop:1845 length:219 start_codon:yes stop_codon:yes gene_type:complete